MTDQPRKLPYHPDTDPASIPDAVIVRENARRRSLSRTPEQRKGGSVWREHRPGAAKGCRCAECNAARKALDAEGTIQRNSPT